MAQALARLTGLPCLGPPEGTPGVAPDPRTRWAAQVLALQVHWAAREQMAVHGFIAEGAAVRDCARLAAGVAGPWRWRRDRLEAALLQLFKCHAQTAYEGVVHLAPARHPAPSEAGPRRQADRALVALYQELSLPYRVIRGTLGERLQQALDHFRLYPVMPVTQAVEFVQYPRPT